MQNKADFSQLRAMLGTELSVSEWMCVDQGMVDRFADLTGDRQWIHVDEARAEVGPFGGRIVHGFLLLSLLPVLGGQEVLRVPGVEGALNYGLDRVRFLTPVRSGSRVRNRVKLLAVEERGEGRALLTIENTMEIEGAEKPALIAVSLAMIFAS